MSDPLQSLADAELRALAAALVGGRLALPFTAAGIARLVGPDKVEGVAGRLLELAGLGMTPKHVAVVIEAILATRSVRPSADDLGSWFGRARTRSEWPTGTRVLLFGCYSRQRWNRWLWRDMWCTRGVKYSAAWPSVRRNAPGSEFGCI